MSKARGPILPVLFGGLALLTAGCGPSLPDLTRELAEGDLEPAQVLTVDGFDAEIVLCEQPRLAAAWDGATPEERRAFLDVAIELVSRSYTPTALPPTAPEAASSDGEDDGIDDGTGMQHMGHDDHGGRAATPESAEVPSDPSALAEVWRTTVAGRAFEQCAGIEARRDSHH